MIELTIADMFLLTWAILATAFAFRFHEQSHIHHRFIHTLIKDKQGRAQFFDTIDKRVTDEGEDATLKP